MLSDEEKEALEILKSFEPDDLVECSIYLQAIEKIKNLIEKQSKEIEELKEEKAKRQWVHIKENGEVEPLFYISKDKIKAKIEEYKKQLEKIEKDDIGVGFTLGKEWSDLKAKVEFGQSLLEKE